MRKFLGALVLFACPALADVTGVVAQNAQQDGKNVKALNTATCKSVNLPKTCTDAEVKAKVPALTIYAVSATGVNKWAQDKLAADILVLRNGEDESLTAEITAAYKAASAVQQSAVLSTLGIE